MHDLALGHAMQREPMDYQVVFSPDLGRSTHTFISAWNYDPECRNIAQAKPLHGAPANFPIDPGTALVFLGGVAVTIASGVITDLVSELLKKKLWPAPPASALPGIEVVVIEQAPDKRLLVVKTHGS